MTISVEGKVALVTGAGSGIGLKFAKLMLSKGCSIIIADLSLRPEAQSLLTQYPHPAPSSNTPSVIFHKTDVTSWAQLTSLWETSLAQFPQVDIVVPVAGLFEPKWSSFWEPPRSKTNPDTQSRDPPADAELGHYAVLDVNLTAPIRLSQMAIAYWTQKKIKGNLIHVASIAGYMTSITVPIYHASKHGLVGFVRSIGGLKERIGIRVSCVAPGTVKTPMWSEDPTKAAMLGEQDELIEPEEIAAAMYRLAVDEELGDGTVLEVTLGDSRVVPQFHTTPPTGRGLAIQGYTESLENTFSMLQHGRMKL